MIGDGKIIMKKIGIITFHCSYNYGSVLQAYALQKYLINNGYNVKIIDYRSKNYDMYHLFKLWMLKYPLKLLAENRHINRLIRRKYNFLHFINESMHLTNKKYLYNDDLTVLNNEFNVFIAGSDQIWNPVCTGGVDSNFFLNFVDGRVNKRIAYAPSLAHASFEDKILNEMCGYIEKFDAISVREESGKKILKNNTNKNIEVVLDPTMLLEEKDYKILEIKPKFDKPYIFVYMLEKDDPCLIEYVSKISQEKAIDIVYIHLNNLFRGEHVHNVYGCKVGEFLWYIRNAKYVVSNSFHATVFSIIFQKKFCTFKTEKSYSRMVGLLNTLGLEDRIYNKEFMIESDINYDEVILKLKTLRKPSESYLIKSINGDSDRYENREN